MFKDFIRPLPKMKAYDPLSPEAIATRNLARQKRNAKQEKQREKLGIGDHKQVRKIILEMVALGKSYIINPPILRKVFYNILQEKNPTNKMNKPKARGVAEVFACICNQYFLVGNKFKFKHSFFVSQSVWDYHLIGDKEMKNGVKFLKEIDLIHYYNRYENDNKKSRKRYYQINFNTLQKIYEMAIQIRSYTKRVGIYKMYNDPKEPDNETEWQEFLSQFQHL